MDPYNLSRTNVYYIKDDEIIKSANTSKLQVLVASYGGCASNYINNLLKQKYNITDIWSQKLCHHIKPLNIESISECVYIYRHPIIAVISQWDRGIAENFYKIKDDEFYELPFTFENLFYLMYLQMKNFKNINYKYRQILIKYEEAYKYETKLYNIFNINFKFNKIKPKDIDIFIKKHKIDSSGKYYNEVINYYNNMPDYYDSYYN